MRFPEFIVDANVPEGTIYLIGMRYKDVQVNSGEPPQISKVIDWDATARASAVIQNIGKAR